MKTMTVYLVPHSSFRGNRPLRSDTIFGAICWGYRLLFGTTALEDLLRRFTESFVPFLLSSMFNYVEQDGKKVHTLPKPLTAPFFPEFSGSKATIKELRALKAFKQLRLVNGEQFSDILFGKSDQVVFEPLLEQIEKKHTPQRFIPASLNQHVQSPHSPINRITGTVEGSRFFLTEEFAPSPVSGRKSGFFFCLKYHEEDEQDLKTVLYFLADKGFSGGASVGKGHARKIEIHDELPYEEPQTAEASHIVTLSLTFPCAKLRSLLEHSWYTLEKRQGKIESMYTTPGEYAHIWKDHLLMLGEGSRFPKSEQPYYGQNCIVRKDDGKLGFDVWQYGYAFTANMKR